jgi:hypothetical protein
MNDKSERPAEVVPIPDQTASPSTPTSRRPGRVHGLAIAGMALCSLVGIGATLAYITVGWPGDSGRYVIAVIFVSVLGFLLSASMAIFAAARDTYAHPDKRHGQDK